MESDAVLKIRLDVVAAKAAQKELDQGFQKATESAAGVGRALFGSLSGLGLALAGPLAAVGGQAVGGGIAAATGGLSNALAQSSGFNAYAGRLGAAQGAADTLASQLGPAAAYIDTAGLKSMLDLLTRINDQAATGADRIRDLAMPEIARRALGGLSPWLERMILGDREPRPEFIR